MDNAFEEAVVEDYDIYLSICDGLPDPDDKHVLAAALKIKADVIVTENLKDFPEAILKTHNLEARSSDDFIADTIALDIGKAVGAIRKMRLRFGNPKMDAEMLLQEMDRVGLAETVNVLRSHVSSL